MDAGITDLPHEVLVYILGLVSSYKDLQHCAQVCHQWRCCAKEVAYQKKKNFIKAVSKFKLTWTKIKDQAENEKLIISKRYSHSAVYDETDNIHSVFVFGGKNFLAIYHFKCICRVYSFGICTIFLFLFLSCQLWRL